MEYFKDPEIITIVSVQSILCTKPNKTMFILEDTSNGTLRKSLFNSKMIESDITLWCNGSNEQNGVKKQNYDKFIHALSPAIFRKY